MSFRGTCDCGRFVFELQGMAPARCESADATRGAVLGHGALLSIPRERLRLLSSEEGVGAYTFSGRIVGHRFCGACGTHLYGEDLDGAGSGTAYVNPRCIARGEQAARLAEPEPA